MNTPNATPAPSTFRVMADKAKDGTLARSGAGDQRLILDPSSVARHGDKGDKGRLFVAVAMPDGRTVNVPLATNVYVPQGGDVGGITFEIRAVSVEGTTIPNGTAAHDSAAAIIVAAIKAKDAKMLKAGYLMLPGMTPKSAAAAAKAALSL